MSRKRPIRRSVRGRWLLLLALLAAALGCQGLEPRWLIDRFPGTYPDVVYYFPTSERVIAMTIDDGPDPDTTPDILAALARHEARATFFLIGERMQAYPELVQLILDQGHELGNHMMHDQVSARLSIETFDANLAEAHELLAGYGGSPWFRPGSGWYNDGMLEALAPYDYRIALASSLPIDPRLGWPPFMSTYLRASVQPGSIVVLHSVGKRGARTVRTLDRTLPALGRRGYRVDTLTAVARIAEG
ncbi:MAG: polysaccharide deacetylase family protein [Pseudomonadota bacterium]